jgi:diaminopimelate epimerase
MHGLGNDFVLTDELSPDQPGLPALARRVCDRHLGIGADGLILAVPSSTADIGMVVYNADGSLAEMCGNGVRCLARFAIERRIAKRSPVIVATPARTIVCEFIANTAGASQVRVDMGKPVTDPEKIGLNFNNVLDHPVAIGSQTLRVTCVGMGNPHAVVFDPIEAQLANHQTHNPNFADFLAATGQSIQKHPAFPLGVNLHLARVDSPDSVMMWTWERGSGATRACGTGACSVVVAGVLTNRLHRRVSAHLPGGMLEIEWADNDHIWMTGPAETVFAGTWNPDTHGAL